MLAYTCIVANNSDFIIIFPPHNCIVLHAGISMYINHFETEKPSPPPAFEPPIERKRRYKEMMVKLHRERNELLASQWDPHNNPKATEYEDNDDDDDDNDNDVILCNSLFRMMMLLEIL